MPVDRLLVSAGPGETRVALCDGERLVDLLVERAGDGPRAGDIHLGRVEKVMRGLGAAFVDIGAARSGFLPLSADDDDPPTEGDAVLVQVVQEPFADKGAKLTGSPSLAGRFLVYLADEPDIRISRRIAGDGERDRLERLMEDLCGEDEGVIVRTSAAGIADSRLANDLDRLRRLWDGIEDAWETARPPACLWREPGAAVRALRDEVEDRPRSILVDDRDTLSAMAAFCADAAPDFAGALALRDGPADLFEAEGIEAQIDLALARRVPLPGGGDIVIEETTALTVIDVNSGGGREGGRERAALAANLAAVAEIAHQLRLRNIGGVVLCDMIAMKDRANGARVLRAFEDAAAADKVPLRVAGFTRMGLVELVRDRRRVPLSQLLLAAPAEPARAPEAVAFAALRAALCEARSTPGAALAVVAAPPVARALLDGPAASALAGVAARLGRPVAVRADPALGADGFRIDRDRA